VTPARGDDGDTAGADQGARDELVERFASFPARVVPAARAAEAQPVPAGEWTPNLVIRHLIAVEGEVWRARLASLAAGGEPKWSWVEPGPISGFDDAALDDILGAFAGLRAGTVALVRMLDDPAWARAGIHATYGRLDVAGLLRLAVDHDEEHLAGLSPA
jgi:hypothetical protein